MTLFFHVLCLSAQKSSDLFMALLYCPKIKSNKSQYKRSARTYLLLCTRSLRFHAGKSHCLFFFIYKKRYHVRPISPPGQFVLHSVLENWCTIMRLLIALYLTDPMYRSEDACMDNYFNDILIGMFPLPLLPVLHSILASNSKVYKIFLFPFSIFFSLSRLTSQATKGLDLSVC